ncbi:mitochondrial carrier homolog 2 [Exaiptasia diaphana]|uniref:Uncharacterized protein n=1 Tax=Exaiptasia diaphana TaxID=2652724 RepID=A0A913YPJ2_EXADI|nr:mitochondrial carrier homolog 2 [Exaiptasia diaphana]
MASVRFGTPPPKDEKNPALSLMLSMAMTTATYPLTSVKLLVQVGHEPIPAVATKTFFGNTVMRLPGLFQYGKHLVKTDGYLRLYSGLVPRLMNQFIGLMVNDAALDALKSKDDSSLDAFKLEPAETNIQDDLKSFTVETCKHTVAKCVAVVVAHPFQVLTVRMVVQYVGKETAYSGLVSSVKEIMNNHGITGFFDGIVPRLVGEVLSLWICRTLHFLVTKYGLDKEVASRKEINMLMHCHVKSNIFLLNRLAGGSPPNMPIYDDWVDCFKHLRSGGNLWRGSSVLRRTLKDNKKCH